MQLQINAAFKSFPEIQIQFFEGNHEICGSEVLQ